MSKQAGPQIFFIKQVVKDVAIVPNTIYLLVAYSVTSGLGEIGIDASPWRISSSTHCKGHNYGLYKTLRFDAPLLLMKAFPAL